MKESLALQLHSVVRNYGKGVTVGPIDCSIRHGEFVSLLGPSGCGKTTMLRCIAGFERVDSGRITVDGKDITTTPPYRRGIGLVFQNYALFPHLTVRENVGFGLKVQKVVPETERPGRIAEVLEMVGLSHLADRYPAQLSGGQQQRVAIARSVVLRPSLLLLDEPLSNLDFKLRIQMRDELRKLQRRLGTTFVYVTHDQTEALAMSDRIVVLSAGHIAQVGTPRDIYEFPANHFVADFIGASNLLKVATFERNGTDAIAVLDGGNRVACRPSGEGSQGQHWVSIRPESIKPVSGDVADGHNVFRAKVLSEVFCGDKCEVSVQLICTRSGTALPSPVTMHLNPQARLQEGALVRIAPGDVLLLGEAA